MTKSTNYRHTFPAAALAEHGRQVILLVGALMLSACGGGGGGTVGTPAPTPITVQAFTSWSDVGAGSAVGAKGLGKQVSYDYQKKTISNPQDPPADILFTFDSSSKLTRLYFTEAVSFSDAEISVPTDSVLTDFVTAANGAGNIAAVSSPEISNPARAWHYQSFGFWEADLDPNNRTFAVFSVGTPTDSAVIPGVDGATFKGKVIGSYVSPDGYGYTALAELQVDVAGQSLTFFTSNTLLSSDPYVNKVPFAPADPALALDLHGTLTYDSATKIFSGSVATTDNRLIGDSTGQFYGPNAEELGGVFVLQDPANSTSLETYAGAYGASRPLP